MNGAPTAGLSVPRSLVLHADDFGLNTAVTHGIVRGFEEGLLTSTSLLANAPAAVEAADAWRHLEERRRAGRIVSAGKRVSLGEPSLPFDLGVHLNLTQGRPLTGPQFPEELLDSAGRLLPPGRLFPRLLLTGRRYGPAVERELAAQIEWLLDRGLRPTHLNGHQYVEMMPVVSGLAPELARRYAVSHVRAAREPGHWRTSLRPGLRLSNWCLAFVKRRFAGRWCRKLDAAGVSHADAFFGASHAGCIDADLLRRFLHIAGAPARNAAGSLNAGAPRVIEIALHPGDRPAEMRRDLLSDGWHDPLATARAAELELLCSTELVAAIASAGLALGRLAVASHKASRAA
ncbi:MAG TPA: ChbG/HpnK family deacetylase [Pirellulales bacterium]|nr:ChbG/HpnK family deacetylase [Pirellulales bacterium]